MSDLDQIKRSHKSARPKAENPAWVHTHHDLGVALKEIERLTAEDAAWRKFNKEAEATIERLTTEVSGKDEDIKLLLAVSDAARDLHKSIILDLHKHDAWHQFDFTADPVDLYWVHHLQTSLQELDKSSGSGSQNP